MEGSPRIGETGDATARPVEVCAIGDDPEHLHPLALLGGAATIEKNSQAKLNHLEGVSWATMYTLRVTKAKSTTSMVIQIGGS